MESYAILYEDDEILVVNKLAPIPVQPEKSGSPSLQDLLKQELAARRDPSQEKGAAQGQFLEAAHRIDRRASGAVAFAKTSKALSTLEAAFRDRRVEKEYIACVEREPVPPNGRLEHRLVWDKRRNVVRATVMRDGEADQGAKPGEASGPELQREVGEKKAMKKGEAKKKAEPEKAVLEYKLVGRSDRYFFMSAHLLTGRHHQIRAQFSAAGFPIRGDLKYGAKRSAPNGLIMLHARRLVLPQPRSGERIVVLAPFPPSEPLWAAYVEEDID